MNLTIIILTISWSLKKRGGGWGNNKPNNKGINLFFLNLKENHLDLKKFEIN